MVKMWSTITADKVFKTDAMTAGRLGMKFLTDATVGAFFKKKLSRSILDTTPLRAFLSESIRFENIQRHLQANHFDALALTAMNYSNSNSTTFVHGKPGSPMWQRSRRNSETAMITVDHVMASAAIPLFFPPALVGEEHFGDGCLRNTAPLSPAIHLGADRILVVSVRKPDSISALDNPNIEPSIARVLGVMLNALLMDAVDVDMERMARVNQTISLIPEAHRENLALRKLEYLWLRPSEDIGNLAGDLFSHLPSVIRYLVAGLGSSKEASEMTSYLLFDPEFCGRLIEIGYKDGLANQVAIRKFLTDP